MTAVKDYLTAAVLIAINIISISCDENYNKGVKREASIRSGFSSFPNFEHLNLPLHKVAMGKTTVEYWPPDLDKKKFYNMKKDSVMELWPKDMSNEMRVRINEPIVLTAPDSLPDIPVNIMEQSPEKFEAMLKPTETSVIEDMAITNRSPIVFPTSEPTTRSPDREVAFVSRGGNKKRKLKKKVKPMAEVPFAEVTAPYTPPMDSVIEVMPNGEQPKAPQVTPIYEYIDEPVVNIFQPIRYTDVISNLSNLTAQTFGSSNKNANSVVQIIDNPSSQSTVEVVEDVKIMEQSNVSSTNSDALEINLNINNDLSPIDIMLDQLKLAIEERDLAKIRNIVQSMDEDEEKLKMQKAEEENVVMDVVTTTEAMAPPSSTTTFVEASTKARSKIYLAPKVRASSVSTTQSPTTVTEKVKSAPKMRTSTLTVPTIEPSSTEASKIYLAPKVRAAQKKLKQVKAKSLSDEVPTESSTASVTEIPIMSTTTLKLSTEKRVISTVLHAEPLKSRPTKRKRSHITPRTRNNLKTATRSAQKHVGRRSGRKQ